MTYNPELPNFKEKIDRHWHMNPDYRGAFKTPPIITFRKNFSLQKITVTSIMRNNKKFL